MDKNKLVLLYYTVGTLKYLACVVAFIGIMFNADGVRMLWHAGDYKSGLLAVDSVYGGADAEGGPGVYYGRGRVDDVTASTLIGRGGRTYTDSVLLRLAEEQPVQLPVWYKSDGTLTLERNAWETSFPTGRIARKLITYATLMIGPFIILLFWQRSLKKKVPAHEQ